MNPDIERDRREEEALSVGDLCRAAAQTLETLGAVRVRGEIGDFFASPAGHWYFKLHDEDGESQLNCAMFRGANRRVGAEPVDGDTAVVSGNLAIYAPRGQFQLIAQRMKIGDSGKSLRAFEALKKKLGAEGLFDVERKRPMPSRPRHVALITSDSSAALFDALSVFQRRAPFIELSLLPTPVQGEAAPEGIVAALKLLKRAAREMASPPQAALLIRGGGAADDLWAFNDEAVVRAVAACPLPLVSGVGHEIDVTLCDLAADLRAPTPTAAAEALSPDREELLTTLRGVDAAMRRAMRGVIQRRVERSRYLRLRHPRERLLGDMQRLDEKIRRLHAGARQRLRRSHAPLARGVHALRDGAGRLLATRRRRCEALNEALELTNPRNVLRRGYAIVSRDEEVIHSVSQLRAGQRVKARLHEGALACRVEKTLAES